MEQQQQQPSKFKTGQLVRLLGDQYAHLGFLGGVTSVTHQSKNSKNSNDLALLQLLPEGAPEEWYGIKTVDDEGAFVSDPAQRAIVFKELTAFTRGNMLVIAGNDMALACHNCLKADPAVTLQLCSSCRVAPYCGKDCQRIDWKRHKVDECRRMDQCRGMSKMPLYEAARNGDVDAVRRLLQEGANVNKSTVYGETALLVASFRGDMSMVECLVQHKADLNKMDSRGFTPLLIVCQKGCQPVAEFLVKAKADVNQKYALSGMSPLAFALAHDHLSIAQWLVQQSEQKVDLDSRDAMGCTPLMMVARKSNGLSDVTFLVEHGASMNATCNAGITALCCAAASGPLTIVRYLVEKGAETDGIDGASGNKSAFHLAAERNRIDVVRYFALHGYVNSLASNGLTALMNAASRDNLPMIQCLVEEGADINIAADCGVASIHIAACKASFPIIQYLVENSADLEMSAGPGLSTLGFAAVNPNPEIVAYIRSLINPK